MTAAVEQGKRAARASAAARPEIRGTMKSPERTGVALKVIVKITHR
jgi:hypothetical protein